MRGERGQVRLDVPRDRDYSFGPRLVREGRARFDGLDRKAISLYARGMTQREIQGHPEGIYGAEISPSLVPTDTDAVLDEARQWQARRLDSVCPVLYLDAIQVRVKSGRPQERGLERHSDAESRACVEGAKQREPLQAQV